MGKNSNSSSNSNKSSSKAAGGTKPHGSIHRHRRSNRKKCGYGELSLSRYIHSINSQFNKDGGMSSKAILIIENFANVVFDNMCRQIRIICNKERLQTCDTSHVDAAAHIVLGYNLGTRASKWIGTAEKKYTGALASSGGDGDETVSASRA